MYYLKKLPPLFLLLFLFFFMNSHLSAQTGEGKQKIPGMEMEVVVLDLQNNPRQGEEIFFVDTASKKQYSGITNESGKFEISLPGGNTYMVKIKGVGEEYEYQTFSIPSLQPGKQYGKSRFTIKYEPPRVFTLDNVYFDVNKAELREESFAELNELLAYMERRSEIRVEIAGHTDNTGDKGNNRKLSQRRAERVKQYLVNNGIDESRIEAKGYGESRPVADNTTKEGRQKNRRTEVHILEN